MVSLVCQDILKFEFSYHGRYYNATKVTAPKIKNKQLPGTCLHEKSKNKYRVIPF